MKTASISNQTIFQTDWSAQNRQKVLAAIPRMKKQKAGWLAPGLPAHGIWMEDVSLMDSRSVKAQLAGQGDFRAAWWAFNQFMHKLVFLGATVEQIMYAFHRRHHAITEYWLSLQIEFNTIHTATMRKGVIGGLKTIVRR